MKCMLVVLLAVAAAAQDKTVLWGKDCDCVSADGKTMLIDDRPGPQACIYGPLAVRDNSGHQSHYAIWIDAGSKLCVRSSTPIGIAVMPSNGAFVYNAEGHLWILSSGDYNSIRQFNYGVH